MDRGLQVKRQNPQGPWALINHSALRHNLQRARDAAPNSQVWAVIKANAYGHGMLRVARVLANADGFAVARLDEALALREAGVSHPILLLEGVFSAEALQIAAEQNLTLTLQHISQLEQLESCQLSKPIDVWVKVDTGMHRLGLRPEDISEVMARLKRLSYVNAEIGLMTHLANGDDRNDRLSEEQCQRLRALPESTSQQLSMSNSAGILAWPTSHADWSRPGIMLYGASPFNNSLAEDEGLRPVMTLQSILVAVRHCRKGESLGYSGLYTCPEDMLIGVVGIGYGDGYPRHAANGTPVLINGCTVPLVGRVSMDMIMVNLQACLDARVGDRVTLWGEGLLIELVAQSAETIAYELLCHVTQRVEFIDIDDSGQV